MLLMVSALIPSVFMLESSNSWYSSFAKHEIAAQASQRIYAAMLSLISDGGGLASQLVNVSNWFSWDWVCQNQEILPGDNLYSVPCFSGFPTWNSTAVSRSVVPTIYQYYSVMLYIPPGVPSFELSFHWSLVATQYVGYMNYLAEVYQGNAAKTGILSQRPMDSVSLFHSGTYMGLKVEGSASIYVGGNQTFGLTISPASGSLANITFGAASLSETSSAPDFLVELPSAEYSTGFSYVGGSLGPEQGPVAKLRLPTKSEYSGNLTIYYGGSLIGAFDIIARNGDEFVYYPSAASMGNPSAAVFLSFPVSISANGTFFVTGFAGSFLPQPTEFRVEGGGEGEAWKLTLVGCVRTCLVTLSTLG